MNVLITSMVGKYKFPGSCQRAWYKAPAFNINIPKRIYRSSGYLQHRNMIGKLPDYIGFTVHRCKRWTTLHHLFIYSKYYGERVVDEKSEEWYSITPISCLPKNKIFYFKMPDKKKYMDYVLFDLRHSI